MNTSHSNPARSYAVLHSFRRIEPEAASKVMSQILLYAVRRNARLRQSQGHLIGKHFDYTCRFEGATKDLVRMEREIAELSEHNVTFLWDAPDREKTPKRVFEVATNSFGDSNSIAALAEVLAINGIGLLSTAGSGYMFKKGKKLNSLFYNQLRLIVREGIHADDVLALLQKLELQQDFAFSLTPLVPQTANHQAKDACAASDEQLSTHVNSDSSASKGVPPERNDDCSNKSYKAREITHPGLGIESHKFLMN